MWWRIRRFPGHKGKGSARAIALASFPFFFPFSVEGNLPPPRLHRSANFLAFQPGRLAHPVEPAFDALFRQAVRLADQFGQPFARIRAVGFLRAKAARGQQDLARIGQAGASEALHAFKDRGRKAQGIDAHPQLDSSGHLVKNLTIPTVHASCCDYHGNYHLRAIFDP